MSAREILKSICLKREKTVLCVYDDGYYPPKMVVPGHTMKGHPTIGTGRALDTNGISSSESDFLLENDLNRVEGLGAKLQWLQSLSSVRQAVILRMIFNMGLGGLQKFPSMIAAIKIENWNRASDEMLNSEWHRQVGDAAGELACMMRAG